MGRRPNSSTLVVTQGLLLKHSSKSPYWQCYTRINATDYRKSTGTADEASARMVALQWYFELQKQAQQGMTLKRVSFNKLAECYLKTVIGEAKQGYHGDTIERHFKPYFGSVVDIKTIALGMVNDYIVHRRTKNAKEPTPQTLNRENTVLRQMLNYAHTQKWLNERIAVPHLSEKQTTKRRPHFTTEEYLVLWRTARRRIKEATLDKQIQHAVDNRRLLYDVIILMANSGLRVDEMNDMTWRNVRWKDSDILLDRAGKMKSSRKLIPRQSGMNALGRIAKRRLAYQAAKELGSELDPNQRVIATADGEPVKSMKTAFRSLLKACGFVYLSPDDRHTLTSLRHTYATFSLTRKSAFKPTQEVLAKQMGTSTRMIQAHYGHDTVEDYRDELRGEASVKPALQS